MREKTTSDGRRASSRSCSGALIALPQTSAGFKERELEEIKDGGRKRMGSEELEVPSNFSAVACGNEMSQSNPIKVEVKCAVPHEKCRRGAHLPFLGREPAGG